MPRKPDPKCVACAQLPIEEAQHRHGPGGDNCWIASRCHRRRSHYRHRGQVNVQRREQYRASQHQVKVDKLSLEVDLPPAAYLYLYRTDIGSSELLVKPNGTVACHDNGHTFPEALFYKAFGD